jgi:hypothetical protein
MASKQIVSTGLRQIGLGTLNVRAYLSRVENMDFREADFNPAAIKTYGPHGAFGAVLYIEKEGFMPLFERVKLPQRHDITIMSSKGMSVTAARQLAEGICSRYGIPLLILHDFEPLASLSKTPSRTTPAGSATHVRPTSSISGSRSMISKASRVNRLDAGSIRPHTL